MIRRCVTMLLFLCAVCPAFADTYNEVSGSGMYIDSVPSGAKIFIDGVERGITPFSASSMRGGEYSVRIEKEGYVGRRFRVVIRRDSRVELSIDLEEAKGQVFLEIGRDISSVNGTTPPTQFNPRISIDGASVPASDFAAASVYEQDISLPVGWRTISVEAFGWEKQSARIYVDEGSRQRLTILLKPAVFALADASLRKKRFNPRDAGVLGRAEINFAVSAPGRGVLEVRDARGTLVYSRALFPFTSWQQQASWDGRNSRGDPVEDGIYTLRISAWQNDESNKQSAELPVQVDTSIAMRPLSLGSSVPGLLFAPAPETLPAFSYQIEGSLVAGKPLLREAWKSLPFAIGLRVSFLDNLEAAAAFNAAPGFSGNKADNEWGAGASVKWAFFRPNAAANQQDTQNKGSGFTDAFGMAAEFSYGWASVGPYTAFGMGTGAALRLPLMYRFLQGERANNSGLYSFDILLSPLVLWAGEKGYPDSGIPRLGAEGGALFSYGSISTGLSVRWDYDPDSGSRGPVVPALELKFMPSSFSLSVFGGFWYLPEDKSSGAFFGAGLGIMY